jgi:hypothetical protein
MLRASGPHLHDQTEGADAGRACAARPVALHLSVAAAAHRQRALLRPHFCLPPHPPTPADESATDLLQPLAALPQLTSLQLERLRSHSLDFSPLSCLTQLQHLVLSSSAEWGCHSFSRLPAAVLQRLSSLQHLHLGSGCGMQRSAEAQLAQLTRLTHLWVLDLRVEGAAAEAVLPLPQLQELGCAYITRPPALAGGALLPQLTQLCVGELRSLSRADDGMSPPHFEAAASQAAFDLCSTRGCLLGLLPLPQLQELQVSVDDDDWAPLAAELAQQTSLTSLSLQRAEKDRLAQHNPDNGVDLEPLAPALQQLDKLQHLTFTWATLEQGCWQAIAGMSQLQGLELEGCSLQLPHLSLLHRCPALEEISLTNCRGVEYENALLLLSMLVVKPGLQSLFWEDESYDLQERRCQLSDAWRHPRRQTEDPLDAIASLAAFLGVYVDLRPGGNW